MTPLTSLCAHDNHTSPATLPTQYPGTPTHTSGPRNGSNQIVMWCENNTEVAYIKRYSKKI